MSTEHSAEKDAGRSWRHGTSSVGVFAEAKRHGGAFEPFATVRCPDYKAEVEHAPHWHVVRAGGITFAQGQCPGWPTYVTPPGSTEADA